MPTTPSDKLKEFSIAAARGEDVSRFAENPLIVTSQESRRLFGENTQTLKRFEDELTKAREQTLQTKQTADQLRIEENKVTSNKDFTTQLAEFNKSRGRAANDSTGVTINEDGTPNFSGVPESDFAIQQANAEIDNDFDIAISQLDTLKTRMDETNAAIIESIEARYAARREQIKDINKRQLGALTTAGFRSGRARFAQEIQAGILGTEEREGIQRLAELDAEELSLIAQARQAHDAQDFKLLSERINLLEQKRAEKTKTTQQLFENALALDRAALQKAEEARQAETFAFEQATQQAQSVALQIAGSLDSLNDAETALFIEQAAFDLGIDPNILAGEVARADRDIRLENLEALKTQASITKTQADIEEGEARLEIDREKVDLARRQFEEKAQLDRAKLAFDREKLTFDAQQDAESRAATSLFDPATTETFAQSLLRTAGGKPPVASERQSLTKSFLVVDQLDTLQSAISDESTGPILGIVRSKNPFDVKAQQIKAQLTSIVPNLARGVFGEVGVLTDTDVALYAQTLPNLNNPLKVRNAILGITLKTVQRSIENQLEVLGASGIDVSGFANKYQRLTDTVNRIEDEIGVNGEKETITIQSALQSASTEQLEQLRVEGLLDQDFDPRSDFEAASENLSPFMRALVGV